MKGWCSISDEQKSELIDLNHAPTFKKLPPAYVVTAQYDVLRDEGEYFAARLFKNNIPVGFLDCLGTLCSFWKAWYPYQQHMPHIHSHWE